MALAKPTPGPWAVQKNGTTVYCTVPEINTLICVLTGRAIDPASFGQGDEEMRANAHLIAAAPDLIAACRRMVEALSVHHMGGREPFPGDERYEAAHQGLYDAIAKSTGQETK